MKIKFLFLICILFLTTATYGQNDPLKDINKMVGSQKNMGNVMGSLVDGIKSSSFTGGKSAKKNMISQLAGVKSSDYLQYASLAGELAGMLKGTSFVPDWANKKDGILDQLKTAGSIADVAGGVGSIAGLLNPGSLTGSFKKNQSSWSSALNILSMIK